MFVIILTGSSTDSKERIEPYRKYYFICEGQNTEVWYFRKLIDLRKKLGVHPLVELVLMEKTDKDDGISNPKALIEFAHEQKQILENEFDKKHDRMVIVFDADIYQKNEDGYRHILKMTEDNDILAISNPSFELFLLLHYTDTVKNIILPEKERILKNDKTGSKRYISKLFTDVSGMNAKKNQKIGELVLNVDTAIKQEKMLNEDIEKVPSHLSCNVGRIIADIRRESIVDA
ncbi:MAG: RloB family protein [Erysipelotrichaceae bacterium]